MDEKLQKLCLVKLTKLTKKQIEKWGRPKNSFSICKREPRNSSTIRNRESRNSSSLCNREPKNDVRNLKVSIARDQLNWKINCKTLIKLKELFGDEFKDEPSSAPDCNGACCKPLQLSQSPTPVDPINLDLNDQTMVNRFFPSLPQFPCISIPADTVILFDEKSVKEKTIHIADDRDQPVCSDTTSDLPSLASIKSEVSDDEDVVFVGEETIMPTPTEPTPIEPTPTKPVIRVRSPTFLGLEKALNTQENALQKDCSKEAGTAEISSHKGSQPLYVVIRVDLPQTSQEDATVEIEQASTIPFDASYLNAQQLLPAQSLMGSSHSTQFQSLKATNKQNMQPFLNQTFVEHSPPIHPVSNTSFSTSLSSYTPFAITANSPSSPPARYNQSHIAGREQPIPQPANSGDQSHLRHSQGQTNLPTQSSSSSSLIQQQLQSTTQYSNSSTNNQQQNQPTSVDLNPLYTNQQQNLQNSVSVNSLYTNQQNSVNTHSLITNQQQNQRNSVNINALNTNQNQQISVNMNPSYTNSQNSVNSNSLYTNQQNETNALYINQQKNQRNSMNMNLLCANQQSNQRNSVNTTPLNTSQQTLVGMNNQWNSVNMNSSTTNRQTSVNMTNTLYNNQRMNINTYYTNQQNQNTSANTNPLLINSQVDSINQQNSVNTGMNLSYANQQLNQRNAVNMNPSYSTRQQNQQYSVSRDSSYSTRQQNQQYSVSRDSSYSTRQQNQQYSVSRDSSYSNQQNSVNLSTSHRPQQLAATDSYHHHLQTRPLRRPQLPIDPFELILRKIQPPNQLPDLSQDQTVMDFLNPQPPSNMSETNPPASYGSSSEFHLDFR